MFTASFRLLINSEISLNRKARTAITKSIALLSSPRTHKPLVRPESALINQGECPPTPTHRPRPLPVCPSANASLTSDEPLPPCKIQKCQKKQKKRHRKSNLDFPSSPRDLFMQFCLQPGKQGSTVTVECFTLIM